MKRIVLAPMILLALLFGLSACGARGKAPDLRAFYAQVAACSMQAQVRADFGDRIADYTLRYDMTADGAQTVTVVAPDEIAGIAVTLSPENASLVFDGLILETGALPGTGLSPLETLPFALACWRTGYLSLEGDDSIDGVACRRAVYRATHGERALKLVCWFDAATLHPVRVETYAEDTCVLVAQYTQVTLG